MSTFGHRPVAALVDIDTLERLRKSDEEFERLRGEMPDASAGRPEDEVRAIVDEAVEAARTILASRTAPWTATV